MLEVAERRIRLSTVFQRVAAEESDRIEIARLLDAFGERGFGALMFMLAVPNLIFLPPGTSAFLGAPLILLAAQLAWGRQEVWLPSAIRRRSLDGATYRRIVSRIRPSLRWLERLLAPRLVFMFGPIGTRLIGVVCLLLAILITLPIPLANFLSGLSVAAFSLALLQRDGLAAIFGWISATISVGATLLVSGAVWVVGKEFLSRLLNHF